MPHRFGGLLPDPLRRRDPQANAPPEPIHWGGKAVQDMAPEELRRALLWEMHLRTKAEHAARLARSDAESERRTGYILPCLAAFAFGAMLAVSLHLGF